MPKIRFDDSLPAFVTLIAEQLGDDAVDETLFVRDATGVLAAVLDRSIPPAELDRLNAAAQDQLDGYARTPDGVRDRDSPGVGRLLEQSAREVRVHGRSIRLLDRRIVGPDWLIEPAPLAEDVPRVAFTSIKGGVGRSTALAVAAAHLAARGVRVLAVDLDLEAPGLGATLLQPDTLPRYGALDWLVENGISGIDDAFRADAISPSWLEGPVDVLPAFGRATRDNPADGLAKIARASIEDVREDGTTVSFRHQVRAMIEACEATGDYDTILVDARAGLHETTAAAVLGLGARVLMFGVDEPQTFFGYRLLLAHIGERLVTADVWRDRAWFVHAKAPAGNKSDAERRFRDLWGTTEDAQGSDEYAPPPLGERDFDVEWSDAEVPLPADPAPVLHVLDDTRFRNFDPLRTPDLLRDELYHTTFSDLLAWLDDEIVS